MIAALSGTLAGPPAFPQSAQNPHSQTSDSQGSGAAASASSLFSDDDLFDLGPERLITWRADLGLVVLAGDTPGERPAWLGDVTLGATLESFTDQGRRWGWVLGVHAERDQSGDAHGGRSGTCPAGASDCATLPGSGLPATPIASDSGFFADGAGGDARVRAMLSDAYLYTDTGWGELRLGYGPGAARLDPVGGPATARLVRADGGHLLAAQTGAIRTRSPLSGQDPKLVFRSVALGQETSVGTLRLSASWTPEVRQCGVDFCPRRTGPGGQSGAVNRHVGELALTYAIQRGGHEWAASLASSQAGEVSGPAGFEPVSSLDAGLSWRWEGWRAGARWRRSNNGWDGSGDFETWSASAGYEQGDWLTTLEYAAASDDWVHRDDAVWQIATSRLIGPHALVAVGLQSAQAREPVVTPGGRQAAETRRNTAFLELGWRY